MELENDKANDVQNVPPKGRGRPRKNRNEASLLECEGFGEE